MRFSLLPLFLLPLACAHGHRHDHDAPEAPWTSLFDGESTDAWRGFKKADVPDGWQAVDGALTRVAQAGDLISQESFENFILELEWRIAPGGNSGIFFHVSEDHDATYFTGPEMQILDDAGHDDLSAETSAGSNYALHAPQGKTVRAAGEWNQVRLVVDGAHVEH